MKRLFAYIRVSTAKQGEQGVSLEEQRDAIVRYGQLHSLEVAAWFEERQTAAKKGRPVFNRMMKLLREGKVSGVIIHKIDRGARNLKDWADLGELIDGGMEVHFANESLDLASRGGRLSADIQAVVAADYVRNLREETRKGFYGRLKQGLYPLPAPLGYLDMGKGRPKEPDPLKAPLVTRAFELYGTGRYNLDSLVGEMSRLGLRNKRGREVSSNSLSILLNNPFYMGLIRLKRTGQAFAANHRPLISKRLFERVQAILRGKTNTPSQRHDFLFRRLLTCNLCRRSLVGERQKGHIYYRCQTKSCPTKCIRQEMAERGLLETLEPLQFSQEEMAYIKRRVGSLKDKSASQQEDQVQALKLTLGQLQDRLDRLTDAYIDRMIDQDTFEQRKTALLMEQKDLEETLAQLKQSSQLIPDRLANFLELAGSVYLQYKTRLLHEKRDLLEIVTSNREVRGRSIEFKLCLPFSQVANRYEKSYGGPHRDIPRTWDRLLPQLMQWFQTNQLQRPQSEPLPSLNDSRAKTRTVQWHCSRKQPDQQEGKG